MTAIHINCNPAVAYYCDTRHVFATLRVCCNTFYRTYKNNNKSFPEMTHYDYW